MKAVINDNRAKMMKQKMPNHGNNKISPKICLCSLKIIDKFFFSIFLTIVGPSGWEKSSLSVQLLQRFIYAAAKVNAVWFIRLIFDLPAGRIVFDSYKGRPLLPEYVARARGHNEIAEYLEDVTKR